MEVSSSRKGPFFLFLDSDVATLRQTHDYIMTGCYLS